MFQRDINCHIKKERPHLHLLSTHIYVRYYKTSFKTILKHLIKLISLAKETAFVFARLCLHETFPNRFKEKKLKRLAIL